MKRRYSEYVNYEYKGNEEWFNPHVEWDTPLFIDPMLLKNIKIESFNNSYAKIIEFFKKAISMLKSNCPETLKRLMVEFDEIPELNLGFAYDSNKGSGLTSNLSLNMLVNLDEFVNRGLFNMEDFANISIFDDNISSDRITDMVANIIKNDLIDYSYKIAKENGFPVKKMIIRGEFDFEIMRWERREIELPYIINDKDECIPILLIPKCILVTNIYCNSDSFISWLSHNERSYLKETFDYNLKKELNKHKKEILDDIIVNNRKEILKKFQNDEELIKPYDLSEDTEVVNSIYESAIDYCKTNVMNFSIFKNREKMPVDEVANILIEDLRSCIVNNKGYVVLKTSSNKFISEPKISKFVQIVFQNRIKDAGFNVDVSPEINSGYGPVDFKISRGEDKVLIENKISSNSKLLTCIDEDKQVHTYLKAENCDKAYLLVFIDKETDIDKINQLTKKAETYRDKYTIYVKEVDCIDRVSASHK